MSCHDATPKPRLAVSVVDWYEDFLDLLLMRGQTHVEVEGPPLHLYRRSIRPVHDERGIVYLVALSLISPWLVDVEFVEASGALPPPGRSNFLVEARDHRLIVSWWSPSWIKMGSWEFVI